MGKMKKESKIDKIPSQIPPYAQLLSDIGQETAKATRVLAKTVDGMGFKQLEDVFQVMAETMKEGWTDTETAKIVSTVNENINNIDLVSLQRWLLVHRDDANSVIDCLTTVAPDGVDILKVQSQAGSQKLVFLANWTIAQREVILKKFRGSDAANRILQRETQTHPLSMAHPNIIETHLLQNKLGEFFLVERRLPIVLNDNWDANGIQEAANLLRDIVSALAFLQDQGRVHGDIKPDNIGSDGGRYILLDFGICRPKDAFHGDVSPTGSLRTRAPELILEEGEHDYCSDIWALGATVFNAITHRFPLFKKGEKPPRVSHPEDRKAFETILRDRVRNEWNQFVEFSGVPLGLKPLLENMLERDPKERKTAQQILNEAEKNLSAVLRYSEGTTHISASEEIKQLDKYLPNKEVLELLSANQRQELRSRLTKLSLTKGLSPEEDKKIKVIEARLPV